MMRVPNPEVPVLHALLLCMVVASPAGARQDSPAVRLQAGDQIQLLVKNEPGLSGRFPVTADGRIMLPLIGLIHVADRSFHEVEDDVRAALATELAEPDLIITPLMRVAVLGEVRAPAMHWLDPTATLGDLLVLAGGLLPTASTKRIALHRDGEVTRIALDADRELPQIPVRSGDRLLIGRRSWFSENLAIFVGAATSVAAAAVTTLIVR